MWITTDQAAEIYARFCRVHYGATAKDIVEEKVGELRRAGDIEGEIAWTKVRRRIEIQDSN